ncbi:MAG: hypothetical protein AABY15_03425 [Nanoarchaeota archaeon]
MHTIQQVIDNQKKYRKLILEWLTNDLRETKKKLVEIKSDDEYIQAQVKKLKNKFKKTFYKKEIDRLFFMHPKRNEKFYAWWDVEQQEVLILDYGKK